MSAFLILQLVAVKVAYESIVIELSPLTLPLTNIPALPPYIVVPTP